MEEGGGIRSGNTGDPQLLRHKTYYFFSQAKMFPKAEMEGKVENY